VSIDDLAIRVDRRTASGPHGLKALRSELPSARSSDDRRDAAVGATIVAHASLGMSRDLFLRADAEAPERNRPTLECSAET